MNHCAGNDRFRRGDQGASLGASVPECYSARDIARTSGRSDCGLVVKPARSYVRIAASLPTITFNRNSDAPSDLARSTAKPTSRCARPCPLRAGSTQTRPIRATSPSIARSKCPTGSLDSFSTSVHPLHPASSNSDSCAASNGHRSRGPVNKYKASGSGIQLTTASQSVAVRRRRRNMNTAYGSDRRAPKPHVAVESQFRRTLAATVFTHTDGTHRKPSFTAGARVLVGLAPLELPVTRECTRLALSWIPPGGMF